MLSELLGIATVLAVGRLALACLPPGWPGDHGPRELAATAAASFLFGLSLLAGQASLCAALGLEPGLALLLAPWALLLVLRLVTLPGAMRPRHEPPAEPGDWRSRLLLRVGVPGLLVPLVITFVPRAPEGPLALLGQVLGGWSEWVLPALAPAAVAVLVAGGLERGRRAPSQRALVFAALAWLPLLHVMAGGAEGAVFAALGLVAAGAGAIAWLRRADRRALSLAWLGLGSAALLAPAGWAPAAAGLGALVLATPGPARRRAALGGSAVLVLGLVARAASGGFVLPGSELLWVLMPLAVLFLGQAALRAERGELAT